MQAIRADLESVKDGSKTTNEDRIHQEAEAAGMDRYKTMKKAQSGEPMEQCPPYLLQFILWRCFIMACHSVTWVVVACHSVTLFVMTCHCVRARPPWHYNGWHSLPLV